MTSGSRYWDSNCFLAWLQEEPAGFKSCEDVLRMAERGDCRIVTSTLTMAEVLHLKGSKPIDRSDRDRVIDFFRQKYIVVSPLTRPIAEYSRELVWDHGIRPKDAIHIATALRSKVYLFNTFDQKLLAKNGKIGDPPMLITTPQGSQYSLDFTGH